MTKTQIKRIVIGLGLAFGFALSANWAVLQLLGQKSADRAEHSLVGILFLIFFFFLFKEVKESRSQLVGYFFLALIPCYFGTAFPDLDIKLLGIGGHRNPVFHSSALFLILFLFFRKKNVLIKTMLVGFGIGLASHLWWDIIFFGDVRWISGGLTDKIWLGANGLLCVLITSKNLSSKHI